MLAVESRCLFEPASSGGSFWTQDPGGFWDLLFGIYYGPLALPTKAISKGLRLEASSSSSQDRAVRDRAVRVRRTSAVIYQCFIEVGPGWGPRVGKLVPVGMSNARVLTATYC